MVRDYLVCLKTMPPRHWDFREWKKEILMLSYKDDQIFETLTYLNRFTEGLIFIFIGKQAENYAVIIDKTKHDIRDIEPYFFKEDHIKWIIK